MENVVYVSFANMSIKVNSLVLDVPRSNEVAEIAFVRKVYPLNDTKVNRLWDANHLEHKWDLLVHCHDLIYATARKPFVNNHLVKAVIPSFAPMQYTGFRLKGEGSREVDMASVTFQTSP